MTAVIRIGERATARLDYYAEGGPRWSCDAGVDAFLAELTLGLLKAMTISAKVSGAVEDGPAHPHPEKTLAHYVVAKLPDAELVSVDPPPGWPFVEGRIY